MKNTITKLILTLFITLEIFTLSTSHTYNNVDNNNNIITPTTYIIASEDNTDDAPIISF